MKFLDGLKAEFRQTFRSLRLRDFRVYTIGQLTSLTGTWMQSVALSWLVYSISGSAAALGTVALASGLPMILLTYFGGMIADRFDRRKVLYATVGLHMLQALALTFLAYTGMITVSWIIVLAVVGGCIGAVEMPARQSFVPDLVPADELTNAIGINSAVRNTTRILGPAIAGLTIGIFGEAFCFGLNALSYVASLVTLAMIGTIAVHARPDGASRSKQGTGKGAGKESIMKVLFDPAIKNVLVLTAAISMFGFQYTVLLPVVVDRILGGNASALGFLSAASGAGALLGSLALASRGKPAMLRKVIGLASLALAAAVGLLGFSSNLWLSVMAVTAAGAAISIQTGGSISLVQSSVDGAKRGRVMAVFSIFMIGFAPIAAMFAGGMAEMFGVRLTLYVSALAVLFSGLLYLVFRRKSEPEAETDGKN
ncbi:MAG: MFS transporter [Candidatus Obscuribacterales bacterium]